MWKNSKDQYKQTFYSGETWHVIRERHQHCHWFKEVWFKYATPKYSFILWTAMFGRLSTGDRMRKWSDSVDTSRVLCDEPLETMEHLFFECDYSARIWETLMKGVLENNFTVSWVRD